MIFISFQVKQEDTDWMTRMEKARVSQFDLNSKQFLWDLDYSFPCYEGDL